MVFSGKRESEGGGSLRILSDRQTQSCLGQSAALDPIAHKRGSQSCISLIASRSLPLSSLLGRNDSVVRELSGFRVLAEICGAIGLYRQHHIFDAGSAQLRLRVLP